MRKTYEERKEEIRQQAINWQLEEIESEYKYSYGEIAEIQNYFETQGRKYGLLTEFRENAIC